MGAVPAADSTPSGEWRGHGLVLVVEDELPVLRLTTGLLTTLGFEVISATDGFEALALFQQHRDALVAVLLDLTVPGMDGEAVLAQVKRDRASLPVVLSSGADRDEVAERFAHCRVAGILQKPYRLEDLRSLLARAVDGR